MDADLLQIQRRRLQRGACAKCGADARRNGKRSVLCAACFAAEWRYCHRCETVKRAADCAITTRHITRASVLCRLCDRKRVSAVIRARPAFRDRATYIAQARASQQARAAEIARLYRAGLTLLEIADALGTTRPAVGRIIDRARRNGYWPHGLKRGRGWRKGVRNAVL